MQHDVYPAYIAWQQYIDNRTRLRQNHTRFEEMAKRAQGVAREGAALLQGLVVCGYGTTAERNFLPKGCELSNRVECKHAYIQTAANRIGSG